MLSFWALHQIWFTIYEPLPGVHSLCGRPFGLATWDELFPWSVTPLVEYAWTKQPDLKIMCTNIARFYPIIIYYMFIFLQVRSVRRVRTAPSTATIVPENTNQMRRKQEPVSGHGGQPCSLTTMTSTTCGSMRINASTTALTIAPGPNATFPAPKSATHSQVRRWISSTSSCSSDWTYPASRRHLAWTWPPSRLWTMMSWWGSWYRTADGVPGHSARGSPAGSSAASQGRNHGGRSGLFSKCVHDLGDPAILLKIMQDSWTSV